MSFTKSDLGAQSAWRGYSSQTLYIASRIVNDTENYTFHPEELEDLLIKKDSRIVEAVQVKDLSNPLTLSDLASTKESNVGEGFFKRVCSLRNSEPMLQIIRVVYFGELGEELYGLAIGNISDKNRVLKKLVNRHGLSEDEASWILSKLVFQKVISDVLKEQIVNQLKSYIPTMAAPELAYTLLIQYISELSKIKGFTSLALWEEKIHEIGKDISVLDGYFKEYQKSLVRLCDMTSGKSALLLRQEFSQGVSTHPEHIRNNFDFIRNEWVERIQASVNRHKAVIVKGVSGQGKTALCLRYLFDSYPEQLVFCVRHIHSSNQAENLVVALQGIVKHAKDIIVFIDVNPGETDWTLLLQELQARGTSIPILVAIREEDFKLSKVDSSIISFDIIDLSLSKAEAEHIYNSLTLNNPHNKYRSFEEAWHQFGENGPFLEFMYLINNNQSLPQRLSAQIDRLISERIPDSWLVLLSLVSYAGKSGCPVLFEAVKEESKCENALSAIERMSKEYLLRSSDDGRYIEALHPLRASIIWNILSSKITHSLSQVLLKTVKCLEGRHPQLLLLDYFNKYPIDTEIIEKLAQIHSRDWVMFGCLINTMLWLDVKLYVEKNQHIYNELVTQIGKGWIVYSPFDITGELHPNKFMIEVLSNIVTSMREKAKTHVEWMRESLSSVKLTYEITDLWMRDCIIPTITPKSNEEWSFFGYSLFWLAKRKRIINLQFSQNAIVEATKTGDIKSKAEMMHGLYLQGKLDLYNACEFVLRKRIINQFCILKLEISNTEVVCRFIPPIFSENKQSIKNNNFNHYWTMYMVDILCNLYPDKDFIDVELVGVDLLTDWGIRAFDYKKRIHRSNLPSKWITELNSWMISRIDYSHRPEDWIEFNKRVLKIRKSCLELNYTIIKYIDFLYKKRSIKKEQTEELINKITEFKKLTHTGQLLPKNAVDPYCLFSESTELLEDKNINVYHRLGFYMKLYREFGKCLNDFVINYSSFIDKFWEVLLIRKKGEKKYKLQNIRSTNLFLFEASKSLINMQHEYNKLFSSYTPDKYLSLNQEELEGMLTLLNVWKHVLENIPRGYSITFKALQNYRRTEEQMTYKFNEFLLTANASGFIDKYISKDKRVMYLLYEIDFSQNVSINEIFKNVVLSLRMKWKDAIEYSSFRWYLETQWPTMVFVPLYNKFPMVGFQIPLYKVLDNHEDNIAETLFPAEIPMEVYDYLNIEYSKLEPPIKVAEYFDILRMQIKQYNDVIINISNESDFCISGVQSYLKTITDHIENSVTQLLSYLQALFNGLSNVDYDKEAREMIDIICAALDGIKPILKQIELYEPIDNLEQFRNASICAWFLSRYLIQKGNW